MEPRTIESILRRRQELLYYEPPVTSKAERDERERELAVLELMWWWLAKRRTRDTLRTMPSWYHRWRRANYSRQGELVNRARVRRLKDAVV